MYWVIILILIIENKLFGQEHFKHSNYSKFGQSLEQLNNDFFVFGYEKWKLLTLLNEL